MKEFYGGVLGFFVVTFAIVSVFSVFIFGLAKWEVSKVINRTMMLAQQRGGVDNTIRDLVTAELTPKTIAVTSVSGSTPGSPYGSQIQLRIAASIKVLGVAQPIGQEIKGTSIYQRRE